jgi:hypothetical protein
MVLAGRRRGQLLGSLAAATLLIYWANVEIYSTHFADTPRGEGGGREPCRGQLYRIDQSTYTLEMSFYSIFTAEGARCADCALCVLRQTIPKSSLSMPLID